MMADRLEITGWDVQRWGGGSDRRANDLPTGWTVVFGQNEEGKSSVVAALASGLLWFAFDQPVAEERYDPPLEIQIGPTGFLLKTRM